MGERERWQAVAWVVGAAIVVFLGARMLGQRSDGGGQGQSAPVRVDGRRPGARGASAPGGGSVYVHVAGAVRRPGLYRLAPRTRVARAIERAGGPSRRANLAAVNLAAPVQDGQQVLVPGPGTVAPDAATSGADAAAPGSPGQAKISLAAATVDQLDGLDGIGPTLAKRIVQYRTAHGGFRSLEQLQEVDGIGAKRFEALKDALSP
jgi:competence protein ComEA